MSDWSGSAESFGVWSLQPFFESLSRWSCSWERDQIAPLRLGEASLYPCSLSKVSTTTHSSVLPLRLKPSRTPADNLKQPWPCPARRSDCRLLRKKGNAEKCLCDWLYNAVTGTVMVIMAYMFVCFTTKPFTFRHRRLVASETSDWWKAKVQMRSLKKTMSNSKGHYLGWVYGVLCCTWYDSIQLLACLFPSEHLPEACCLCSTVDWNTWHSSALNAKRTTDFIFTTRGGKKQTFLQLKKSFFLPHSWHLCSKTCFILLSMLWLKLSLFVTSIASVSSLPILREHTATLVSSDMLAFSFHFSLSHVEAATQGSTSRLSALDQRWDGTQVADLCQVASMCFNRSRVVVVFYMMSRPAVTLHSHWPLLHWSSDYAMILWSLLFCVPRMPHVSPWACIFEHIWNPLNRLSIQFWMLFVVKLQCIFCILPCSTDGILNFCCTEITFWARFILCQVRYIKLLASRRCFTFSISCTSRTFTSRVTKRIYQFSDKLLA